jgi:hypothetical protein
MVFSPTPGIPAVLCADDIVEVVVVELIRLEVTFCANASSFL